MMGMPRLVLFAIFLVLALSLPTVHGKKRYYATPGVRFDEDEATPEATAQTPPSQQTTTKSAVGERDMLEQMLKESDVLNMLETEQVKHERRLKELQMRVERELGQVQEHFESVMIKLKKTEEQLEHNIKNVERSVMQKMGESKERLQTQGQSWRWPFFFLILALVGLGAFFARLYRNATKNLRML